MSRYLPVVLAFAFLVTGLPAEKSALTSPAKPEAQKTPAPADIRGVWKVTELAWRTPGGE